MLSSCAGSQLASFRIGETRAADYTANRDDADSRHVLMRFEAATPAETSLFAGRQLATTYQFRTLGPALAGSSLVVAFDETFRAQIAEDRFDELADGARLLCHGPGDPLVWINDCTVETVALGAGLIASGYTTGNDLLSVWAFTKLYNYGGDWSVSGAGLIASGWMLDLFGTSNGWLDVMLANGTGLIASGWSTGLLNAPLAWFDNYLAYGNGLIASGWVINPTSSQSFSSLNALYTNATWNVNGNGLIASGRTFLLYFNLPYVVAY